MAEFPIKILALDLGTKTGVAHNLKGDPLATTWTLAKSKSIAIWGRLRMTRRADPRIENFVSALTPLLELHPDAIVFEDVAFMSSTYQTQLWASFRGALWAVAARFPGTLIECVPVATLKKFATGHGGATKDMMAASLYRLHPEWKSASLDDNAVDALWLFYWAEKHLKQAVYHE